MEIPSTVAGVVKALKVQVGDKVSEGSVILELAQEGAAEATPKSQSAAKAKEAPAASAAPAEQASRPAAASAAASGGAAGQSQQATVVVPDIGDATDVEVIEIMVSVGDHVDVEQGLITVESDKASMEVPSSHSGVVKEVRVKLGDKVNQGSEIVVLEVAAGSADQASQAAASPAGEAPQADAAPAPLSAMHEPDVAPESTGAAAPAAAIGSEPVVGGGSGKLASAPPERHSPTESFASADVPLRNLPHA